MRRILTILLVLLGGCASHQKRTDSLLETSVRFQEGLRWGRYEDAASHVPPADRETFLDEHDELSDSLRIDDYEVIRVHFRESHEEAMVQVKYTWHLDGEGIVKETVTDQRWQLHGTAWWMEEEAIKRGADMPGLEGKKKAPEKAPEPTPASGGNASGDEGL